MEALAGDLDQSLQADGSTREDPEVLGTEVLANHSHDVHGPELAGGQGEVAGGAAQDLLPAAEGGLKVVEGDASNS